jgi:hypothetical protein
MIFHGQHDHMVVVATADLDGLPRTQRQFVHFLYGDVEQIKRARIGLVRSGRDAPEPQQDHRPGGVYSDFTDTTQGEPSKPPLTSSCNVYSARRFFPPNTLLSK